MKEYPHARKPKQAQAAERTKDAIRGLRSVWPERGPLLRVSPLCGHGGAGAGAVPAWPWVAVFCLLPQALGTESLSPSRLFSLPGNRGNYSPAIMESLAELRAQNGSCRCLPALAPAVCLINAPRTLPFSPRGAGKAMLLLGDQLLRHEPPA